MLILVCGSHYLSFVSSNFLVPLGEEWLLEIPDQYQTRVNVKVKGTTMGERFYDGSLEDLEGIVTQVMRSSDLTQTASVHFKSRPSGVPSIVNIPIKYLAPVHPTRISEHVYCFDGPQKGKVAVVRAPPENTTIVVSSVDLIGGFFEIDIDMLVVLTPIDDS